MRYLETYKKFESKSSQAREASKHLDNNKEDVFYIFLEYVDKYNLTEVNDIFNEEEQINKYTINSEMRYTRHGAYGETTIEISFKDEFEKFEEFKNDMKEFKLRLKNQGSSVDIEYDDLEIGINCRIEIV